MPAGMTSATLVGSTSGLPPRVPPLRYARVADGLHRGAYPSLINMRFLKTLRLRTLLTLTPEPPNRDLAAWCASHSISALSAAVSPFSEEVTLSHERAAELLAVVLDPEAHPLYLHCIDGVAVTGTLVMCLRKLLRWSDVASAHEYARFARVGEGMSQPPPQHVLRFVRDFRPEQVLSRLQSVPRWLALCVGPIEASEEEHHEPGGGAGSGIGGAMMAGAAQRVASSGACSNTTEVSVSSSGSRQLMHALALEGLTLD